MYACLNTNVADLWKHGIYMCNEPNCEPASRDLAFLW